MDPNAALAGMRRLCDEAEWLNSRDEIEAHMLAMRDQFRSLDEWLSKGGFLPDDWNQDSTLNPGLATDIVVKVSTANKRVHPNSGQVAVLTAVAMLQMRRAASNASWAVPMSEVGLATRLSESTVRKHLNFWAQYNVLVREDNLNGRAYRVAL